MKMLVAPFIGFATAGLLLSLVVHVSALFGVPNPLGEVTWYLHIGIFVVWIPAGIVSHRLTRDAKRKDWWKVALQGCPIWMRYLTYGFFGYALINFAVFFLRSIGGVRTDANALLGFSGHWMAFYSAAVALLTSFLKTDTVVPSCAGGHEVSRMANYCEICGQPVQRTLPG